MFPFKYDNMHINAKISMSIGFIFVQKERFGELSWDPTT